MRLKHIELKGFKSFAKKERLIFEKDITAIVGPNGSGKSNIAEAFRFILGEQSMKSLRSKKTEDLLFNGSKLLQRVNRASVSLVLDNRTQTIKEAFDLIEIERIIHRDATNEYYINGSRVRLKDITEMLSQAKVGVAGHNIISQGEADRILSISPRDRKEYLDEALGLIQYQHKKIDSLKKLKKTEENTASVHSLIREMTPHLRYLEKEMRYIEKKKEYIEQLKEKTREYIACFIPSVENNLTIQEAQLKRLTEKFREAKAAINTSEQQESPRENHEKQSLEREYAEVGENLRKLQEEKSQYNREVGRFEAELSFLQDEDSQDQEVGFLSPKQAQEHLSVLEGGLEELLLEDDLSKIKERIRAMLDVISKKEGDKEEDLRRKEKMTSLKEKIISTQQSLESLLEKEALLGEEREEIRKKLSEIAQGETLQKSTQERDHFKLQSLQTQKESIERDISILKQEHGYFYSSLEEISLLTRTHFKEELKASAALQVTYPRDMFKSLEHEVERLKLKIEGIQVGDTQEVEREYHATKEREAFLLKEVEDLTLTSEKLLALIEDLDKKIEGEFKKGISTINSFFSTFFSQMFKGGGAELIPVDIKKHTVDEDEKEEIETGIEIKVTMPHKKIQSISMLSGGEKTLVSIALIFALSQVNPPPFLVLDETDAALDEANSKRYGEALQELSKHSQLILITHNRETMSRAGMLYGVTMGKAAVSELLSIDLEEAEKIVR